MNREIHVPLREGLGVRFLWATRPDMVPALLGGLQDNGHLSLYCLEILAEIERAARSVPLARLNCDVGYR